MAYQAKTRIEDTEIATFLDGIEPLPRQAEARRLVEMFADVTGYGPKVYTGGMIGFGAYAYRYKTGHSGEWFATGFAVRKANLTIHVMMGFERHADLLAKLGPHRLGKSCLYLNRLDKVDAGVLRNLIAVGLEDLKARWPVTAT